MSLCCPICEAGMRDCRCDEKHSVDKFIIVSDQQYLEMSESLYEIRGVTYIDQPGVGRVEVQRHKL